MSRGSSRGSSRRSSSTTSPTPRVRVPRHIARLITRLVVDYFTYTACPVASKRHAACRVTHCRLLRLTQALRRLLRLRRASGCLGTSRGSSSTTSTTPRVWVPRHVAWLITRLVARLIVDYFDYAARPGAWACRAARHVARRANCRRLLRLRRASGCLGTSRGSSPGSLSTTSPTPCVRVPRHVAWLITRLVAWLIVNYFDYAKRPGAWACRAARHTARRATHRRLLRLRCASGCLGTSRGSSHGSSSNTSTMSRV
jgi:hypothetical protein